MFNLSSGFHIIRWIYHKDYSLSGGEDRAFIDMIEIEGISYADDYCMLPRILTIPLFYICIFNLSFSHNCEQAIPVRQALSLRVKAQPNVFHVPLRAISPLGIRLPIASPAQLGRPHCLSTQNVNLSKVLTFILLLPSHCPSDLHHPAFYCEQTAPAKTTSHITPAAIYPYLACVT